MHFTSKEDRHRSWVSFRLLMEKTPVTSGTDADTFSKVGGKQRDPQTPPIKEEETEVDFIKVRQISLLVNRNNAKRLCR
jgi:hypothetical protein